VTVSPERSPASAADAALALDAALFEPRGWFCLDARNVRVHPGSLPAALALVGQGQVATVVGRLRPEAAVVDVDAAGATGDAVREALLAWCAEREVWALARASGGGAGRCHVFCLPGPHAPALGELVAALRAEHRLPVPAVDLRRQVRPLSAPHRTGAASPLPRGLTAALRAFQAVLGQPSAPARATPAAPSPDRVAYAPAERPARPLPEQWQRYLEHGERPADAAGWTDRSSSTAERVATFWLVVAGHSEDSAWTAIAGAHPDAFSKARRRGRSWWRRHVWTDAGQAADSWLTSRPAATDREERRPLPATTAARAALERHWLRWGRDERHTLRAVLEALLDRMDRTGSTTVPCPERDLLLDTPLRSRATVRSALRRLAELGFGQRLATFTPGGEEPDERSHTFALDERFCRAGERAVRLLDPPLCHTPPPPLLRSPGLWRLLGLPARHTYRAVLTAAGQQAGRIAVLAGLVHSPDASPTPAQLRTTEAHLRALAGLGLVQVDATGCWSASTHGELPASVTEAAAAVQQQVADTVEQERNAYRARLRPDEAWQRQRAAALARAAKRDRARQRAWWDGLEPAERDRRRTERAEAFAALSPVEQAARKARLAEGRQHVGLDEEARRLAWIAAQPDDVYAERVAERTVRFAGLAPPEQAAAASAWQAHRVRYGLSRRVPSAGDRPVEAAAAAPEQPSAQQLLLLT
jgi:hypothetical protein